MRKKPILSELSEKSKLRLILKQLKPDMSILEVGIGYGSFSDKLKKKGYRVTTLDIDNPKADIVGDINDWRSLKIKPNSFDAVIALEVIEHVDCLKVICAICKTGGLIMLSSPHPNWDWVMKLLETFRLTQKRTSPHTNLTDFDKIDLTALIKKRPLFIHQVAIFKNIPKN
jgi:2-polyprenyl-3-methyl-5-hydroxy-6-metoxy-1,4-benzoquinol methylase